MGKAHGESELLTDAGAGQCARGADTGRVHEHINWPVVHWEGQ